MTNHNFLRTMQQISILTELDKKTLVESALKLSEEVGEVSQAVLSYTDVCGCGYKNLTKDDVIEECLDTVIVALSIAYKCGVTEDDFRNIINAKLKKWEEKITKISDKGVEVNE